MMRLISLLLLSVLGISNFVSAVNKTTILLPDKKIGRLTKVLSNQIYIRFKKENLNINRIIEKIENSGISFEKRILSSNNSYKFSSNRSKFPAFSLDRISEIIKTEEPLLRTFRISYSGNIPPEIFCRNLLKKYNEIEIAEPVSVDEMLGSYIPNDALVMQQGLLAQCKIFDLWEAWKGDSNVVIGISDGGVFQQHEDLVNSIAPNWGEIPDDGIDNDANGYIDDFMGYNMTYKIDGTKPGNTFHNNDHGSGVAGIACASTDNTIGIAGIGFNCRFFPIKTAVITSTSIIYGYESIIYAAIRGVKVLNCSWGQIKQFSQIDQSIINYAVARDVAIVAAAGNANQSLAPFYPASYDGVMSVGNVTLTDEIAGTSSLGTYLDIMAPGESSYITTNQQGGYIVEPSGGTSFAAPVVSGVLALVRSRYPELSPLEAIEFTRQMTDDISGKNPTIKGVLRGRVNGFKLMYFQPMSIPGIVFDDKELSIDGERISRLYENQTADLKIKCRNILGNAKNLRFVLSMGYDFQQAIKVIDSVVSIDNFDRNTELILNKFKIKANKDYDGVAIFRVDIYGDNNYHDFFMFQFIPTPEMTTFGNNVLQFSVGDRGQLGVFGSGEDAQGIGVTYKEFGNMIYNSGLMVTASDGSQLYSSTSIFGSFYPYTDFTVVKPFTNPEENTGILNDMGKSNKIGVEVKQIFHIPPDNFSIASIDITLKNISSKVYDNMAAGYFFDWDIMPNTDSNLVELFPEAIPESIRTTAAAAEVAFFYRDAKTPACGCAAYSENINYKAAATGMDYSIISDFTLQEQYASLNTGTLIQFKEIDDVNMVVGMAFPGSIGPNETREFKLFFGCADSKDELAQAFRDALLGTDINDNKNTDVDVSISPNPAYNFISVISKSNLNNMGIYNILGESQLAINSSDFHIQKNKNMIRIDISGLSSGIYFLRINNRIYKFIKM